MPLVQGGRVMDDDEKPNIMLAYDYYGIEVLGRDVGGWRKSACPMPDHEDANPSASVNEEACRWRCHTCDRGGDVWDIVMEREPDVNGLTAAKRRAEELFGETSKGSDNGSSLLPVRRNKRRSRDVRPAPWTRL